MAPPRFIGRVCDMQVLSIVLVLISIGTIVGPIGGVVVMYRDNLVGLVVTPQIRDIMNGNSTILPINSGNNDNNNYGDNNGNTNNGDTGTSVPGGFLTPVLVSAQIDNATRTLTVTVNVTNPLSYDLTVNSLNSTIVCNQHNYQLGAISLANPVMIPAGQTSQVTISGYWTQDAENHIHSEHQGATSIDINLVNTAINVNGIVIQSPEPINAGSIPFN
jgi:hypothetical protein